MYYTNENIPIRFKSGSTISRPWLNTDESGAQEVLKEHYGEPATCRCTPTGVPMHVVCRDRRYYLATMPGRSHHHALSCPSYQPDPTTSGLRHYSEQALGRANRQFCLAVRAGTPTGPPFNHFSPSAALQFLWELAGLNVCTPKTVAKRDLRPALRSLHEVASIVHINQHPIEPYVPSLQTEIDSSRYVIGQVKSVVSGKYGNGIRLTFDQKNVFWVDEDQWTIANLQAYLGPFDTPQKPQSCFILGKLWSSSPTSHRLFDLGALPTGQAYLPSFAGQEFAIEHLIVDKRRFFVCLPFDAPFDDELPFAVLIDRDTPKNLYASLIPAG